MYLNKSVKSSKISLGVKNIFDKKILMSGILKNCRIFIYFKCVEGGQILHSIAISIKDIPLKFITYIKILEFEYIALIVLESYSV